MLSNILNVIQEKSGTQLKDSRLSRAKDYIISINDSGEYNYKAIYEILATQPLEHPLWHQVIQQITVGETYFFRNRTHFNALRHHILPKLIQEREKNGQKFLRIWIAGCATGEEPYSIAMLLHDVVPNIQSWSIFLLATDINEAFLQFAKQGIYGKRAFRNETPDELRDRWFTPVDNGYKINPKIKQMVSFGKLNLVEPTFPSLHNNTTSLDLIMCRNVTIYFDKPTTQALANRFFEALRPDGWLIVGHSEPQPGVYNDFESKNFDGAVVYHKSNKKAQPDVPPQPSVKPAFELPIPAVAKELIAQPAVKEAEPIDIPSLLQQAFTCADQEDWQMAMQLLDIVEEHDMYNPLLHYVRGLVWSHTDQFNQAVHEFRKAVYCEPNFALAYCALGELFHKLGDHKEANNAWQRASKSLRQSKPEDPVFGAEDLTVEMLNELISFRLG